MIELIVNEASWSMDASGTWLMLKPEKPGQAQMTVGKLKPGKRYTVTIKEYRKPKSLNANNYFWNLCSEIAEKLGRTKNDIYIDYIKEVGIFKDFRLTRDEAETFRVAWSEMGTGWPTEDVDYDQDGDRIIVRAYYGSSRYNGKQMSRIIDMAVQDAKSLGIETLTPEELARMNLEWGEKAAQANQSNGDT